MASNAGQAAPPKGGPPSATEELPVTLFSWIVIGLAMLSYAISFVDRVAWSTAIPIAAPQMKLSMAEAGGLMTAFYIGYVASNFPAGWFVDRFGPKLTLGVSTLITGVFTLLFPFGDSYTALFILRIGAGIGGGALFAAGVKYQLAWFTKARRATAMGLVMTGPSLGTAIASGGLAPIIKSDGWQTAFTYAGIGTLVVGVLVLLFARERGSAMARGKKPAVVAAGGPAPTGIGRARDVMLRKTFIFGCIACFLSIGANQGFTTWIVIFFTKVHGFDLVTAGGIFAASSMFALIGPTASGVVSDFLGRRKAVCFVGAAGVATTIVILAITKDVTVLWAVMLVKGVIGAFLGNPLNTLQAESAAGPHAGTAMGVYNGVAQLGSVIFPIGLGFILDVTSMNYFIVLITIAVTYVLCATAISFMYEKSPAEKKAEAQSAAAAKA